MSKIVPVILCGGQGSRLWPLSRENHPKQFIDLGGGRTLFGDTLERGCAIAGESTPIVLTNERYRFLVRDELFKHDQQGNIICEPIAKNTAPAIALAALSLLEKEDEREALMLILPSDHFMDDLEVFSASVKKAKKAALNNYIVTFGISPTYPSTAFGYICKGKALDSNVFKVNSFVEKPKLAEALKMLAQGEYYWNAGIFLMRPKVFLNELEKQRSDIYEICLSAWQKRKEQDGIETLDKEIFSKCPASSIDYAVMENTKYAATMPLDLVWNDLGSWDAFFKQAIKDRDGNASFGKVIFEDCSHCQAFSKDRLVAVLGMTDLNIISTPDAVLISKNGSGEKIKALFQTLKSHKLYHYDHYPKVYETWGNYENLVSSELFQIRQLVVNPGQSLFIKLELARAIHLSIISGKAKIGINNKCKNYSANQALSIHGDCEFSIENPGKSPLILVEIKSGDSLEDNKQIYSSTKVVEE